MRMWLALACACSCTACGSEPGTEASATTRWDSAGITIVESAAPVWTGASEWLIDTVPKLSIGGLDATPEYALHRVQDVVQLSDGRIVVADLGTRSVRTFSRTGEFEAAFGQEGDGPGEFRWPNAIATYPGDSIAVFDSQTHRVTIVSGDLELGRIVRIPDLVALPGFFATSAGDLFLLARDFADRPATSARFRTPQSLVRLDASGVIVDTVVSMAGGESEILEDGSAGPARLGLESVAAIDQGRVYWGDGDAMRLHVSTLNGQQISQMRVPGFPLELEDDRRARLWDSTRVCCFPDEIQRMLDETEVPPRMPAYAAVTVDPLGFVWASEVKPYKHRDLQTTWQVFGPDGRWMGSVVTPDRFEVHQIGADFLLGVGKDELDVETVQVLPLRR